jgi:hypothetical protein
MENSKGLIFDKSALLHRDVLQIFIGKYKRYYPAAMKESNEISPLRYNRILMLSGAGACTGYSGQIVKRLVDRREIPFSSPLKGKLFFDSNKLWNCFNDPSTADLVEQSENPVNKPLPKSEYPTVDENEIYVPSGSYLRKRDR